MLCKQRQASQGALTSKSRSTNGREVTAEPMATSCFYGREEAAHGGSRGGDEVRPRCGGTGGTGGHRRTDARGTRRFDYSSSMQDEAAQRRAARSWSGGCLDAPGQEAAASPRGCICRYSFILCLDVRAARSDMAQPLPPPAAHAAAADPAAPAGAAIPCSSSRH